MLLVVLFFYNPCYERNYAIFKEFIFVFMLFGLTVKLYNYIICNFNYYKVYTS